MYLSTRRAGARAAVVCAFVAAIAATSGCAPQDEELVVYSSRNEQLIRPIFDEYEKETGVRIAMVTDKAGPLIKRLQAEGEATEADVLLTVDAGNLWYAKELGLLAPVESATLARNVPDNLRDPDAQWFGLSVRARTLIYNTDSVDPGDLVGYADLAEEKWRGRLCLRTAKKVYNQSLVAMLIAEHGEEETERIVRGWIGNLATRVFASDNQVIEAVAAGQCDVGVVNTYYLGRLLKEDATMPVAIAWADQQGSGVHVNVSGGAVTRHAPNRARAVELLEWLSEGRAQELFAGVNMEFPANPDVPTDPFIAAWGEFKANPINVSRAGELQGDSVRLMDRAGYQ